MSNEPTGPASGKGVYSHDIGEGEVEAALSRITASEQFRESPQITAFLNYIVRQTLAGKKEQIKAYTIAIEALNCDESFDASSQSLVRVAAARLRDALSAYYSDEGATDPIVIDVPLGRYIPTFSRRASQPSPPEPVSAWRKAFRWRPTLRKVTMVALICAIAVVIVHYQLHHRPHKTASPSNQASTTTKTAGRASQYGQPTLFVEPIDTVGVSGSSPPNPAVLRNRIIETLTRFEEDVVVLQGAAPDTTADYRLLIRLTYEEGDVPAVYASLVDQPHNSVAWAYDYGRVRLGTLAEQDEFLRDLGATLMRRFGVIHSTEWRKFATLGDSLPAAYRCVLNMHALFRQITPELRQSARDCLEQALKDEPAFAYGHTLLAGLDIADYRLSPSSDKDLLKQAFELSSRAIDIDPASARAYYTLMLAQSALGHHAESLKSAEKALALNPFDTSVHMYVGEHLVSIGEIDKAMPHLKEAQRDDPVPPSTLAWTLFLAAYLKDDVSNAIRYANEIRSDYFWPGFFARALAATKAGDRKKAKAALARLREGNPNWLNDPRSQLKKFIVSDAFVDRLAADLEKAIAFASQ